MAPGERVDVAVVGAGPAGSHTAALLAREGLDVVLLEEHGEVGRPVACAGLLSNRVHELLGREVAVLNRVSRARLHAPAGHVLSFDAGRPRATVVDRAAFDRELAQDAVRAGANLQTSRRVLDVRASAGGCTLTYRDSGPAGTARGELSCRALVGADGPGSLVRGATGIARPRTKLTAYQVLFATRQPIDASTVELYAGRELAPGFFAWAVPRGEHEGLVGLAAEPGPISPRERLETFMAGPTFVGAFPHIQLLAAFAGVIPMGPVSRPVADGVVLVGDAAAQVKATSGGGVYPALVAARHASEALVSALEAGEPTARALAAYPRAFDREVGAELRRAARLRRAFRNMSDGMVDDLLSTLADPELLETIVREGEIEFPSRLVRSLLQRSPRLVRLVGPLLRGLF